MAGQPETDTEIEATRAHGRVLARGTAVAVDGKGVLIVGPSGSGKSALALSLIALGATLIADDRVEVTAGEDLTLSPPHEIAGKVEARFLGILGAATTSAPLALVVDLERREMHRLPPPRTVVFEGRSVPLLHAVESAYFPAAILQYLKGGRYE